MMGKHFRTEDKKKQPEAVQLGVGGVTFIQPLPVNFDTFDNVGSVFRAYVDCTSSFFSPRSVSIVNHTFAVI